MSKNSTITLYGRNTHFPHMLHCCLNLREQLSPFDEPWNIAVTASTRREHSYSSITDMWIYLAAYLAPSRSSRLSTPIVAVEGPQCDYIKVVFLLIPLKPQDSWFSPCSSMLQLCLTKVVWPLFSKYVYISWFVYLYMWMNGPNLTFIQWLWYGRACISMFGWSGMLLHI